MSSSQHQHATADAPLRYVFIDRPRCPACDSTDLQTIRSQDQHDGTTARRTTCKACGHRFFVIVE